jgi:hypothetical protein
MTTKPTNVTQYAKVMDLVNDELRGEIGRFTTLKMMESFFYSLSLSIYYLITKREGYD